MMHVGVWRRLVPPGGDAVRRGASAKWALTGRVCLLVSVWLALGAAGRAQANAGTIRGKRKSCAIHPRGHSTKVLPIKLTFQGNRQNFSNRVGFLRVEPELRPQERTEKEKRPWM